MSEWTSVAPVNELPPGARRVVNVDGAAVAVFNLGGRYYAVEDVCTHDGGELASGKLEGEAIVCPRHGARFSIKTGEVLSPPAYESLAVMAVRVADGLVQVRDERWE